jgi:hypothetical protein
MAFLGLTAFSTLRTRGQAGAEVLEFLRTRTARMFQGLEVHGLPQLRIEVTGAMPGSLTARQRRAYHALCARVDDELACGAVVVVDGWILSKTERLALS